MSKTKFYNLEKADRVEIFNSIAEKKGMPPFAVEKDWWVCKTLEIIFQMEIAKHLVFKGGTSLSKAWKLIHRFSEDIDLAIDKDFFHGFKGEISRTRIQKLRKQAGAYTTGTFFDDLKKEFKIRGYHGLGFQVIEAKESDQDPRILEIFYPYIIQPSSNYILPRVQIEISCRSLREPFSLKSFGSLVDEEFSDKDFSSPLFTVPTVNATRTFLEKLFLLHEEFQRPLEKIRVDRLSRHLYDIYQISKAGFSNTVFNDKQLYESIVAHRYKYSRISNIDYNLHSPKSLNAIPIRPVIQAWKEDYGKMKEDMIYEAEKPSFEDLVNNLSQLQEVLKNVDWKFDLKFNT